MLQNDAYEQIEMEAEWRACETLQPIKWKKMEKMYRANKHKRNPKTNGRMAIKQPKQARSYRNERG